MRMMESGKTVVDLMSLKVSTLSEARRKAITIEGASGAIGQLVPIGPWILQDPETIAEIAQWRQFAMKMFLVQFKSSPERTTQYLKRLSIDDPARLLFMIEDSDGTFVGHLGVSNVTHQDAELDNLMRGRRGGPPELALEAERAILNWAFSDLAVERVYGRVISYNFLAINIHNQFGFHTTERLPLVREEVEGQTVFRACTPAEANVNFTVNFIELKRGVSRQADRA